MEEHRFIAAPRGEPMSDARAGARVRIALDSPPGPRWSDAFASHLTRELMGMPGVARLSLDHAVQGDDVVLEGVELEEGQRIGPALKASLEAANHACARPAPEEERPRNMDQATADRVAEAIAAELG